MENPHASIILPTYNRAYCMPAVVDSLLAQSYRDFELLIVDDGSTDATADLIARRYRDDPRVRYHSRDNGGVSAARNTGIELARADVLVFCDSDDIWLQHRLMLQMAVFARFPDVNLVWTDVSAVDPDGRVLHRKYTRVCYPAWREVPIQELFGRSETVAAFCPQLPAGFDDCTVHVGDVFVTMIAGTLINMPTVAVRASLIGRVGNFNTTMASGEDYDFNLRASSAGPVAFIDTPTVLYRIGAPDQLTRLSMQADQARNYFRTVEPVLAREILPSSLSPQRIRNVLSGKYRWLASAESLLGNRRAARRAWWQSIRHGGGGVRTWLDLFSTFLPSAVERWTRAALRRIKPARHTGF
jgi:GT2 family glycosyltransferase